MVLGNPETLPGWMKDEVDKINTSTGHGEKEMQNAKKMANQFSPFRHFTFRI
jgi:hypothetical protein